jgi:hypothetical protein
MKYNYCMVSYTPQPAVLLSSGEYDEQGAANSQQELGVVSKIRTAHCEGLTYHEMLVAI